MDPEALTRALARASGASVTRAEAIGLVRDGDRVAGVRLGDGGSVSCGTVVLAQGPWAGSATAWTGTPVDVQPLKGEILRLEASGPAVGCSIGWRGNYATTKPDGLLWVGTTEEDAGFDDGTTMAGRTAVLAKLARMLPVLETAKVVAQTACLRPMSADGHVVLGPVPDVPGVLLATGGGRKGIRYLDTFALQGGAADRLVVECTSAYETDSVVIYRPVKPPNGYGITAIPIEKNALPPDADDGELHVTLVFGSDNVSEV